MMSVRAVLGLLIGILFFLLMMAIFNNRVINTTVLIQEGHVGRTKGNTGSIHNGLVESKWNTTVGKEVERILEKKGIDVTRVGASIPIANASIAVAIHFDGAVKECSTGASIGYNLAPESKAMARRWRAQYGSFFPFKWHQDNFTRNLSHYYGFSQVQTTKGFLVLELGELTCKKQTDWLEPRLKQVAAKIAHFIIKELER
jgi:N-acetylmuramoyl-L-alanine amidase